MASFKNNRKCIVCSEIYTYCPNCSEFADRTKYPTWMAMFHNANCKELFDVTSDLSDGTIDKKEAKERFNKCDLSYKDKLHKNIVEAINQVNGIVSVKKDISENETDEQSIKKRSIK